MTRRVSFSLPCVRPLPIRVYGLLVRSVTRLSTLSVSVCELVLSCNNDGALPIITDILRCPGIAAFFFQLSVDNFSNGYFLRYELVSSCDARCAPTNTSWYSQPS